MVGQRDHLQYASIRDVISILDSANLQSRELDPQYRAMQIANRALIAHHAIEKAFKARLQRAPIQYPKSGRDGHDLVKLYELTKQISDGKWAEDLARAYQDIVGYYEYNVAVLPHLATLETYLAEIGQGKDFMDMRYWLSQPNLVQPSLNLINNIILVLHREILEALWRLVASDDVRLVSWRVEDVLQLEIQRVLAGAPGTETETTVKKIIHWLYAKPNYREALREVVQRGYEVEGLNSDEVDRLKQAFEQLSAPPQNPLLDKRPSDDPAVEFFITSCRDLLPSSQINYPYAEVIVKWLRENQTAAELFTPAGQVLGFIEQHAQSRWVASSLWDNAGSHSKSFEDVKHWLINQNIGQITIMKGLQVRKVYIFVGEWFSPSIVTGTGDPTEWDDMAEREIEVPMWDATHGLEVGQDVTITHRWSEEHRMGDRIVGVVAKVDNQKVTIRGSSIVGLVD